MSAFSRVGSFRLSSPHLASPRLVSPLHASSRFVSPHFASHRTTTRAHPGSLSPPQPHQRSRHLTLPARLQYQYRSTYVIASYKWHGSFSLRDHSSLTHQLNHVLSPRPQGGIQFVTDSLLDDALFTMYDRLSLLGVEPNCGPKTAPTEVTFEVSDAVNSAAIRIRYIFAVQTGTSTGSDEYLDVPGRYVSENKIAAPCPFVSLMPTSGVFSELSVDRCINLVTSMSKCMRSGGAIQVWIAQDGVNFCEAGNLLEHFTYYDEPIICTRLQSMHRNLAQLTVMQGMEPKGHSMADSALSSRRGPASGGTKMSVFGTGFSDTGNIKVRFREIAGGSIRSSNAIYVDVEASFVSPVEVTCITPKWPLSELFCSPHPSKSRFLYFSNPF